MGKSTRRSADLFIGIDASRNRSGGAKSHLAGILKEGEPSKFGISQVHVWSYRTLLDALPESPWLIKHNPAILERGLLWQIFWQRFLFPRELAKAGCKIVLNTSAGTVSRFKPSVTMSRDMLSYEPGEMQRFGWSTSRLRLIILRYVQNRSLQLADGAVFLTRYAGQVIQGSCGRLSKITYIPHGVGLEFRNAQMLNNWPSANERPIRCLYVSNSQMYKHQWIVVQAIEALRKRGHNITLTLIGGGTGQAQKLLEKQMALSDPQGLFVKQLDFVKQSELPKHLINSDLFVFASSCENMPNTLIEAMAVGLPIACSNRGPMPEVFEDGGVYFDPENSLSISNAIELLINDPILRMRAAHRAKELSMKYSWSRCANETWKFVVEIYNARKMTG